MSSVEYWIVICVHAFCTDDVLPSCPLHYGGLQIRWAATNSENSIVCVCTRLCMHARAYTRTHIHRAETKTHGIIPSVWYFLIFSALSDSFIIDKYWWRSPLLILSPTNFKALHWHSLGTCLDAVVVLFVQGAVFPIITSCSIVANVGKCTSCQWWGVSALCVESSQSACWVIAHRLEGGHGFFVHFGMTCPKSFNHLLSRN